MSRFVARFLSNECGATAIEYALLAAGIGIVILAGIGTLAVATNSSFVATGNAL